MHSLVRVTSIFVGGGRGRMQQDQGRTLESGAPIFQFVKKWRSELVRTVFTLGQGKLGLENHSTHLCLFPGTVLVQK